jgi:curli biogenesis system outer membrane secretion channel CsgG
MGLFVLLIVISTPLLAAAGVYECDPIYDQFCDEENGNGNGTLTPRSGTSSTNRNQDKAVIQAQPTSYTYQPFSGPKQTVAVLPFENKVQNVPRSFNLGEGFTEMLITELLKTKRYILVERTAIQEIIKEQSLGQSGLVRQETAPRTGGLAGAQFLIKGAVTEFKYAASGGGAGLMFKGFNIDSETKSAHVGVDVRIIDARTGQIVTSHRAQAKADASGFKLGYSESDFRIGGGKFENTPLGVATRAAIHDAVMFIIRESGQFQWYGKIIKVVGNTAYINRGSNNGLKMGQVLRVFSQGEALIDPETGLNLGADEEYVGDLSLTDVKNKYSIGELRSNASGRIKRGDTVKLRN